MLAIPILLHDTFDENTFHWAEDDLTGNGTNKTLTVISEKECGGVSNIQWWWNVYYGCSSSREADPSNSDLG